MSLELGLQLYSVRNALQRDPVGTLEAIAAIGYKHLQVNLPAPSGAGTEPVAGTMSPAELNRWVDGLGMDVPSVHAQVDERTDWDRLVASTKELGSSAIAVPIAFYTDRASVLEYARALDRYGERCRRQGLRFYYHNHFHEFQVVEGQTIMDLLLEHTDGDLVSFELDTYWAARGGADPAEWLLKLGPRCDLTHQKDLPVTARPVSWFDVFGREARITLRELIQTQRPEQFAEIGEGTMDVAALLQTMRQIGVEYVFVEQDMSARDELESVRVSYQNMAGLLRP
jgi:sugar phosphate isomerase/epimerase